MIAKEKRTRVTRNPQENVNRVTLASLQNISELSRKIESAQLFDIRDDVVHCQQIFNLNLILKLCLQTCIVEQISVADILAKDEVEL